MPARRRAWVGIVAAALALHGVACTTGEPAAVPPTFTTTTTAPPYTPTEVEDLERTVRTYWAAWFGGDPATALALRSQRCRAELPEQVVVDRLAEHTAAYPGLGLVSYSVQFRDSDAFVNLRFDKIEANQHTELDQFSKRWVREGGAWRWDACPPLSGLAASGESTLDTGKTIYP